MYNTTRIFFPLTILNLKNTFERDTHINQPFNFETRFIMAVIQNAALN